MSGVADAPQVAEFTLTLKGHPERVGRVLRAMQTEYAAIEEEAYEFTRGIFRDYGFGIPACRVPTGLEGTITIKNADLKALGWR